MGSLSSLMVTSYIGSFNIVTTVFAVLRLVTHRQMDEHTDRVSLAKGSIISTKVHRPPKKMPVYSQLMILFCPLPCFALDR